MSLCRGKKIDKSISAGCLEEQSALTFSCSISVRESSSRALDKLARTFQKTADHVQV
jgi:hypothetical protein